jgi:peptidoglycan/LPS O-acetylase OafA/YrhL
MSNLQVNHGRLQVLDSIRGISALMVVLYHFTTAYFMEFKHPYFPFQLSIGHFGVQSFFILSGFVIFMSIAHVNSAKEFIIKRIIRLYPSYWICLIITFAMVSYFGLSPMRETTFLQAAVGLTMLQGFILFPNVDPSYWSLRPELIFYFFMALILFFKLHKWLKPIMIIISSLLLLDYFTPLPLLISRALNIPFCAYFFSGIILFKIFKGETSLLNYLLLVGFCIINIIIEPHAYGYVVIPIIYSVFMLFAHKKINFFGNKYLVFLGFISYPLYLIHQNVGYVILTLFYKHLPQLPFVWSLLSALAFVFLLATLIAKYVEKPLTQMLRSFLQKFI